MKSHRREQLTSLQLKGPYVLHCFQRRTLYHFWPAEGTWTVADLPRLQLHGLPELLKWDTLTPPTPHPPHSCAQSTRVYLLFTRVVITTLWRGSDRRGQRNGIWAPGARGSVFTSDQAAKVRDDLTGIIHNNDRRLILNSFISHRNSVLSWLKTLENRDKLKWRIWGL